MSSVSGASEGSSSCVVTAGIAEMSGQSIIAMSPQTVQRTIPAT